CQEYPRTERPRPSQKRPSRRWRKGQGTANRLCHDLCQSLEQQIMEPLHLAPYRLDRNVGEARSRRSAAVAVELAEEPLLTSRPAAADARFPADPAGPRAR